MFAPTSELLTPHGGSPEQFESWEQVRESPIGNPEFDGSSGKAMDHRTKLDAVRSA